MEKLHQLRDMLCEELEEFGTRDSIDMHGLQTVDMLAHAMKNLDKIIESDGGGYSGEYSGGYSGDYSRGDYSRGEYSRGDYSRRGNSGDYSRGGRRRDSMGRYSATDLRSLMDRTSDERTRGEIQRMLEHME